MTAILFEHFHGAVTRVGADRHRRPAPRARLEPPDPVGLDRPGRHGREHRAGRARRTPRCEPAPRRRAAGSTTSATTRPTTPSAPPTARTTTGCARSSAATTPTTSSTSTTTSRPRPGRDLNCAPPELGSAGLTNEPHSGAALSVVGDRPFELPGGDLPRAVREPDVRGPQMEHDGAPVAVEEPFLRQRCAL